MAAGILIVKWKIMYLSFLFYFLPSNFLENPINLIQTELFVLLFIIQMNIKYIWIW